MLRDVYCFAVSILELMIGRTSSTQSILALDALPLTWAEFHESTPLIQVLADCIQLDSITLRKGKLKQIRQTLIVEFKKFFQRAFYKLETPFVGKKADVLNKRGTVALFNRNEQEAIRFWQEARQLNEAHFDSHANYGMFMWTTAKVTDSQMMQSLADFVFQVPHKGQLLEACLNFAIGEPRTGSKLLTDYLVKAKSEAARIKNKKVWRVLDQATKLQQAVLLAPDAFPQNFKTKHSQPNITSI